MQAVADKKAGKGQAISVPPKYGKTRVLSIEVASWLMGRFPGIHIAVTSFSVRPKGCRSALSGSDSNAIQQRRSQAGSVLFPVLKRGDAGLGLEIVGKVFRRTKPGGFRHDGNRLASFMKQAFGVFKMAAANFLCGRTAKNFQKAPLEYPSRDSRMTGDVGDLELGCHVLANEGQRLHKGGIVDGEGVTGLSGFDAQRWD